MARSRLDKIDKKILEKLQDFGRMTNVELANGVGISAPPCLRRVRMLQDAGYIKSYHAELDPVKMGYGVHVFAMVALKSQAEADLTAFEKYAAKFPMIRECHVLTGDTDYFLRIVAKSWDLYQDFLINNLLAAPNVASVKSSLSVRASKSLPGVPVE